jgi:hypothetical protein
MSAGSESRPGPTWLRSAISPTAGPTTRAPRSRRTRRLSCTAGLAHILSFIAGASSHLRGSIARSAAQAASSAWPMRSRASRFAVAGATRESSAQSASAMCPAASSCSAAKRSAATGAPVSAWKVRAETNFCAEAVIAQRTCAPALTSKRATSHAL